MIPIRLMELLPASLRTFVVSTSYQLGSLVSSVSATIEVTLGERFPLPLKGSMTRHMYLHGLCIRMCNCSHFPWPRVSR